MRTLERILLIIGIVCLGLYGIFTLQTHIHQRRLERALERQLEEGQPKKAPEKAPGESPAPPPAAKRPKLAEGDLVGRLEIPRLNLSVMVMEGIGKKTLMLGAGHIPATSYPGLPGNSGIAAHRDTFFRKIRHIQENDVIRFTSPHGVLTYRVKTTSIVKPTDVHVLNPTPQETMTLVTCYPFFYVGSAPKRFVVQAVREHTVAD